MMHFFKNNRLKLICIFILAIFFTFISSFGFNIAMQGRNKEKVIITLAQNSVVNEIKVNNNVLSLKRLRNKKILFDDDKLIAKESGTIEFWVSSIDDIIIGANHSDNSNFIDKVQIADNTYKFTEDYFYRGISKSSLLVKINRFTVIYFILIFFVIYFSIYCINKIFNYIHYNTEKWYHIVLLAIFEFLVCFSSIFGIMFINKYLAILFMLIIYITIGIKFKFKFNSWHEILAELIMPIGILVLFLIPPGHVPDEPSHFARSFIDANYISYNKDNIAISDSVESFFYKFVHNVHSPDQKFSAKMYLSSMLENPQYDKPYFKSVNYENTRYLTFLPYLPTTLLMLSCKLVAVPVIILFYLSRFINFLISVVLCYLAIKTTPRYKKLFTLITALPIFLQQQMGLNMDYITNSIIILFIAVIFKYSCISNKLSKKNLLVLGLLGIGIGLCKFGYFPLLLLIMLISNDKFSKKKIAIIFKILFCIVPIIISVISNVTLVGNPNDNNELYTLNYVFSKPLDTFIVYFRTFMYRIDLDFFRGMIDGFGWSTKYFISSILWTTSFIFIIMLVIDDEEDYNLSIFSKIVIGGVIFLLFGFVYTAAFTEWTPYGAGMINGIQTRYFLPAILLFYIVISNHLVRLKCKEKTRFYSILLAIVHILLCYTLVRCFY